MKIIIPAYVKPFLWSYNVEELDGVEDKKRIITNVLNLGTKKATDWLFSTFDEEEIKETIRQPIAGEWNKKSINFWSLVFGVEHGTLTRVIPV